jgi:hypothetical protein
MEGKNNEVMKKEWNPGQRRNGYRTCYHHRRPDDDLLREKYA